MEEKLGLMLYGYGREHAMSIADSLERTLGDEVILMSASGREEERVGDVLSDHEPGTFLEKEMRFAMLLGFSDQQIRDTLKEFPETEKIPRPIFTTLTPTNVDWTVAELKDDLLKEDAYFKKRKENKAG